MFVNRVYRGLGFGRVDFGVFGCFGFRASEPCGCFGGFGLMGLQGFGLIRFI